MLLHVDVCIISFANKRPSRMLTNTAPRARKRMAATSRAAASDPAPLLVHFIYGLSDTPSERAFSFAHYSSIRSAFLHLQPAKLLLHHHHEPATANAAAVGSAPSLSRSRAALLCRRQYLAGRSRMLHTVPTCCDCSS